MKRLSALFLFFAFFLFLFLFTANKAYASCKANYSPKDNLDTRSKLNTNITQTKKSHEYTVSLKYDDTDIRHADVKDGTQSKMATKDNDGLNFLIDFEKLNLQEGNYKIIVFDNNDTNNPGCFDGIDMLTSLERKIKVNRAAVSSACKASFSPTENLNSLTTLTVVIDNAKIGQDYVVRLIATNQNGTPNLGIVYYEEIQKADKSTLTFSIDFSKNGPDNGIFDLFAGNYIAPRIESTEKCFDTVYKNIVVGNPPASSLCPAFWGTDPASPKPAESISLLFKKIDNDTNVYSVTVDKDKNFSMAPSESSVDVGSYKSGTEHSFTMKVSDSSSPNNGAECSGGKFEIETFGNNPCFQWAEANGRLLKDDNKDDLVKIEDRDYPKKCIKVDTAFGPITVDPPTEFVGQIFGIILGLAGGIALLLIIKAGYEYMVSQGNPEKLQGARDNLTSAIVGLIFIIFSILILHVIGVDILRIPGFG